MGSTQKHWSHSSVLFLQYYNIICNMLIHHVIEMKLAQSDNRENKPLSVDFKSSKLQLKSQLKASISFNLGLQ